MNLPPQPVPTRIQSKGFMMVWVLSMGIVTLVSGWFLEWFSSWQLIPAGP